MRFVYRNADNAMSASLETYRAMLDYGVKPPTRIAARPSLYQQVTDDLEKLNGARYLPVLIAGTEVEADDTVPQGQIRIEWA